MPAKSGAVYCGYGIGIWTKQALADDVACQGVTCGANDADDLIQALIADHPSSIFWAAKGTHQIVEGNSPNTNNPITETTDEDQRWSRSRILSTETIFEDIRYEHVS